MPCAQAGGRLLEAARYCSQTALQDDGGTGAQRGKLCGVRSAWPPPRPPPREDLAQRNGDITICAHAGTLNRTLQLPFSFSISPEVLCTNSAGADRAVGSDRSLASDGLCGHTIQFPTVSSSLSAYFQDVRTSYRI